MQRYDKLTRCTIPKTRCFEHCPPVTASKSRLTRSRYYSCCLGAYGWPDALFHIFYAVRLTAWIGTACWNIVDSVLYWLTLYDCSYSVFFSLPFSGEATTLTFTVAKLVQAAFCKYQMPYSLNFFKNFLPSAVHPIKTFLAQGWNNSVIPCIPCFPC